MICLMDFGGKCIIKEYTPDKYIDGYNKNKNPFFTVEWMHWHC